MVGRIFVLMEIRNPIYSGSRGFRHRRDETKKSIKNILSTYECVCAFVKSWPTHFGKSSDLFFIFFLMSAHVTLPFGFNITQTMIPTHAHYHHGEHQYNQQWKSSLGC